MGTPYFMSPELYNGENKQIRPSIDIWGLGVTAYMMCSLKVKCTFKTNIENDLLDKNKLHKSEFTPDLKLLLFRMIFDKPEKRPSLD